MVNTHSAQALPGNRSAGHTFPLPSDSRPVFMFGTFNPNPAPSVVTRARHAAWLGTRTEGGSIGPACHLGSRSNTEPATDGANGFMFGVHPE
jgi:hypothetical protein